MVLQNASVSAQPFGLLLLVQDRKYLFGCNDRLGFEQLMYCHHQNPSDKIVIASPLVIVEESVNVITPESQSSFVLKLKSLVILLTSIVSFPVIGTWQPV